MFHDEEYDGIVLKIPSWLIPMNDGLPELMAEFAERYESLVTKSLYYSDHQKNIAELTRSKAEHIANKKERDERAKRLHEESIIYKEKLLKAKLNYDMIEVSSERKLFPSTTNAITFNDGPCMTLGDKTFTYKEMLTPKTNIRSAFQKEFDAYFKTLTQDEILAWFTENHEDYVTHCLCYIPKEHWKFDTIVADSYGCWIQYRFIVSTIKLYETSSRGNVQYIETTLSVNDEGYIGTYAQHKCKYDDYEFRGGHLIKKGFVI